MNFRHGTISGIIWKTLSQHRDGRGWLCELYRQDEVDEQFLPVMGYASVTNPGVARGPHEHVDQSDYFCFFGPGDFQLFLWDVRPFSPTRGVMQVELVGASQPMAVIVPPGVVHAYRNVSDVPGLVFNCPNRLYKGWDRAEPVDEIRHEDHPGSPFTMDLGDRAAA